MLFAGVGVLTLLHRNVRAVAETWVAQLHLNPAHHYPRIFLDVAADAGNGGLWTLAVAALVYASVRAIEAYALWHGRAWAQWFAVLSGSVYIPFELRELYLHPGPITSVAVVINILIVGYLAYGLRKSAAKV